MEANGIEDRRDGCVEDTNHLFHWVLCKTGMPRILVATFLGFVQFCEDMIPKRITLGWLRVLAGLLVIVVPRTLTYLLLYPIFRLVFGNLYPAYASYKAVRTKNVKEYVKWMMYWIVFALFTCAETFTDLFFSFWFPFYYEIKTILVVWLLSPATKGSSILYRRFVHPALIRREAEIDEALARATEQGYTAVLHLGSKGVNYATTVLMQTAIKYLVESDPDVLREPPASQSDSAISSSAKYPAMPNPRTERKLENDFATTNWVSSNTSVNIDDFVPMEAADDTVAILNTNANTELRSDALLLYDSDVTVDTKPTILDSPPLTKKTTKNRKPRKKKTGSTRNLRSNTRKDVDYSEDYPMSTTQSPV